MKLTKLSGLLVAAVALSSVVALAKHHTPEERGMALFNNPDFAGGKKACSACHPGGRGLTASGAKTKFSIMGGQQDSLEEAINFCLVNANRGEAIDKGSEEMQELVSYIKSLGNNVSPGYGAPGYRK